MLFGVTPYQSMIDEIIRRWGLCVVSQPAPGKFSWQQRIVCASNYYLFTAANRYLTCSAPNCVNANHFKSHPDWQVT